MCTIWEYIVQYKWVSDTCIFQYSMVNLLLHCLPLKKHAFQKNGGFIHERQKMSSSGYFDSDLKSKVCAGHAFRIWWAFYRSRTRKDSGDALLVCSGSHKPSTTIWEAWWQKLSHHLGAWKSFQVWAGLFLLKAWGRTGSRWLLTVFGVFWLLLHHPNLCLHLSMTFSLHVHLCPKFPFL